MVISAAASLGAPLEAEWTKVTKSGIKQGWGMSEVMCVCVCVCVGGG